MRRGNQTYRIQCTPNETAPRRLATPIIIVTMSLVISYFPTLSFAQTVADKLHDTQESLRALIDHSELDPKVRATAIGDDPEN